MGLNPNGEIIDAAKEGFLFPVAMDIGTMYSMELDPDSEHTETSLGLIFYCKGPDDRQPTSQEEIERLPQVKLMFYPSQAAELVSLMVQTCVSICDDAESAGLNVL